MKQLIPIFFLLSILGCSNEHINKVSYNVVVGETVEIFFGENSCCGRCWNGTEIKHLEFVEEKSIEYDEDCAGCTNTYSRIYRAMSPGIDTIKTYSFAMSDSCNLESEDTDMFLVTIKNEL